jgi:hypothetical protein
MHKVLQRRHVPLFQHIPRFPFLYYNRLSSSVLTPSSCLLMPMRSSLCYVLNGSSTVRYSFFNLYKVQLFPGLGLYSGIFAMYLQRSHKVRDGNHPFLRSALSTVTVVIDLVSIILGEVTILSARISFFLSVVQTFFQTLSLIDAESFNFALRLSKPQQAIVVISSPNVS